MHVCESLSLTDKPYFLLLKYDRRGIVDDGYYNKMIETRICVELFSQYSQQSTSIPVPLLMLCYVCAKSNLS